MAAIKIAQLTNQVNLNDTDVVIVETATSTNKTTVANLAKKINTFKGALHRKSTSQSIAPNTPTPVSFETQYYDTSGFLDGSKMKFVIPSGVSRVRLAGNISWGVPSATGSDTSLREVGIRQNGNYYAGLPYVRKSTQNAVRAEENIMSSVVNVSAGDYFEMYAGHSYPTNIDVVSSLNTWFSVEVIE